MFVGEEALPGLRWSGVGGSGGEGEEVQIPRAFTVLFSFPFLFTKLYIFINRCGGFGFLFFHLLDAIRTISRLLV